MTDLGLYIHVPFCKKRCGYCDFYSGVFTDKMVDEYTLALIRELKKWGGSVSVPISTVYFGGGTPSLLNRRLPVISDNIRQSFKLFEEAEITLEVNPQGDIKELLENAKAAGVNRLSIGVQTSSDKRLRLLGRTHTKEDAKTAVFTARSSGFSNISLDLMLGLPDSNIQTLKKDLEFLVSLNPEHISCYILKIEENTAFSRKKDLNLPDEDAVCDQYLYMCDFLKSKGYLHYEISNFCKEDMQSKHNLKYWNCEEYLGIGPSAHSFYEGKRFYYPKDLKGFINCPQTVFDQFGGQKEEKIMLKLRLEKGIDIAELSPKAKGKCELFAKNNLGKIINTTFSLTDKGMLVSNSIITEILEVL